MKVVCNNCEKDFNMKPGVLKSRQETGYPLYCSIKCRMESTLKRNTYTCSICDKSIYKSYKSKNKDGKCFVVSLVQQYTTIVWEI